MNRPLVEKTLLLLSKSCDVTDVSLVSRLSIGERDARLLQLREWMFGTRLENTASCPKCGERLEWETNTKELHLQPLPHGLSVRTFELSIDDFKIIFRLPDSDDILRVSSNPNHGDYKKVIADCIIEVTRNEMKYLTAELPESIWTALDHRMAKEDPQADICMKIQCPTCSHQWETAFDIVSFLWTEINHWAQRIMQEVYMLARSFGWSENEILSMSARRRQQYIQMLGA